MVKCPECDDKMDPIGYDHYRCEDCKLDVRVERDNDYDSAW